MTDKHGVEVIGMPYSSTLFAGESQVSHMKDIPVTVIRSGTVILKWEVEDIVLIDTASGCNVSVGTVKATILNDKPDVQLQEMLANSSNCRVVLCVGDERTIIPDYKDMVLYTKPLSINGSLAVVDLNTTLDQLLSADILH